MIIGNFYNVKNCLKSRNIEIRKKQLRYCEKRYKFTKER
jgi:hypothetical protein